MESAWADFRGVGARTALVLLAFASGSAWAQSSPPIDIVTSLSTDVVPIERDFEIAQSGGGQYKITLTDLGALLTVPAPAPLDSVHVLVTRGGEVVTSFDGDQTSAVSTALFDATPGTYTLHVVGKAGTATGSGPVGLKIASVATSTAVLDFSATLAPPEAVQPGLRSYSAQLDVPADGQYSLVLADLAFPHAGALQTAGVFVFQDGASSLTACLSIPAVPDCPTTKTVTLAAGHYQLVAAGALIDASDGAVFSVHIASVASGAVLHSRAVELGRVTRVSDSSFLLNAGDYALGFSDLAFPAQLGEAAAMVTRAAQVTALANATTPTANFTVAADGTAYDVFSFATADATAGAGSYDVELKPAAGGASVLSAVEAVGAANGRPSAYAFAADIGTAGTYRAKFGDFQFPAPFSGARVAIVQNGVVVGKTDSAVGSTLSLDVPLAAGRATALVLVQPASGGSGLSQSGGTFGLEMAVVNGTQNVLDVTQGVGGLVSVKKVSILNAGRYDLTVSDLDFPDGFQDLMAVVSRGSLKLGTVVVGSGGSNAQGGSATLTDIDTTAGNYSITLLARPGTPSNAATYRLHFVAAAPAPTVTLTATPTSVSSGQQAGLTWTSTGATSCTASSSPAALWSGTKATSGTDSSGAIVTSATFTIRCTDAVGRSAEKSVTVDVTAPSNSGGSSGGGGGALGGLELLALFGLACGLGRRRLLRPR